MANVLDTLENRGYVEQVTDKENFKKIFRR